MELKKRILVTGSNGLLGQKLVKNLKLNQKEFELIACSRGENRISDQEGYQYYSLDLLNDKEIKQCFDLFKPDVVIHTAAMTNVDACEADQENCWALNVNSVKNIDSRIREIQFAFHSFIYRFCFRWRKWSL